MELKELMEKRDAAHQAWQDAQKNPNMGLEEETEAFNAFKKVNTLVESCIELEFEMQEEMNEDMQR